MGFSNNQVTIIRSDSNSLEGIDFMPRHTQSPRFHKRRPHSHVTISHFCIQVFHFRLGAFSCLQPRPVSSPSCIIFYYPQRLSALSWHNRTPPPEPPTFVASYLRVSLWQNYNLTGSNKCKCGWNLISRAPLLFSSPLCWF